MVADHLDADGEVMSRLRSAFGPKFPIAITLDLHGNLSQRLIENASLAVAYRTCPHVDQFECGQRAAHLLVKQIRGEIRPTMALAKPPFIFNIMAHDTATEPLRWFMQRTRDLERQPGILAVSLLPGFPYADVPQMGPSVLVITQDNDLDLASPGSGRGAGRRTLGSRDINSSPIYRTPRLLSPRACCKADKLPVLCSSIPATTSAARLSGGRHDYSARIAFPRGRGPDSVVLSLCTERSEPLLRGRHVANEVTLTVGGKVDRLHGEPVEVVGRVRLLHDGNYLEAAARHGGRRLNHMGLTALVELPGRNLLVLTTQRHPPFSLGQLTCVGIDPSRQRILVVKAAIAYKAAYVPIAGTIIEVDTPGLTAVNPMRSLPAPVIPALPSLTAWLFPLE